MAGKVFGVDLQILINQQNDDIPKIVSHIVEYLTTKQAYLEEGLFRIPGNTLKISELKKITDKDGKVDLFKQKEVDPHTAGGLLKLYLRELPVPVIIPRYYSTFMKVYANPDQRQKIVHIRKLIMGLPKCNRDLLMAIVRFLHLVAEHESMNKMSSTNLAVIFAPNLIRNNNENLTQIMEDSTKVAGTLQLIIEEAEYIEKGSEPLWFSQDGEMSRSTSGSFYSPRIDVSQNSPPPSLSAVSSADSSLTTSFDTSYTVSDGSPRTFDSNVLVNAIASIPSPDAIGESTNADGNIAISTQQSYPSEATAELALKDCRIPRPTTPALLLSSRIQGDLPNSTVPRASDSPRTPTTPRESNNPRTPTTPRATDTIDDRSFSPHKSHKKSDSQNKALPENNPTADIPPDQSREASTVTEMTSSVQCDPIPNILVQHAPPPPPLPTNVTSVSTKGHKTKSRLRKATIGFFSPLLKKGSNTPTTSSAPTSDPWDVASPHNTSQTREDGAEVTSPQNTSNIRDGGTDDTESDVSTDSKDWNDKQGDNQTLSPESNSVPAWQNEASPTIKSREQKVAAGDSPDVPRRFTPEPDTNYVRRRSESDSSDRAPPIIIEKVPEEKPLRTRSNTFLSKIGGAMSFRKSTVIRGSSDPGLPVNTSSSSEAGDDANSSGDFSKFMRGDKSDSKKDKKNEKPEKTEKPKSGSKLDLRHRIDVRMDESNNL